MKISHLKEVIKKHPEMKQAYIDSRNSRSRVTTVYDISSTCNLKCEGCLYFDKDGNYAGTKNQPSLNEYREFFLREKKRGVNYPIFGGAEASLNQSILLVASEIWSQGMVHTNGTIRIDSRIPFRLYVSSWGHRELTNKWRGANCYDKVLRNISGDKRVIVNYTVNRMNIDDIQEVITDCVNHNLPVTFQVYSPTTDYLSSIKSDEQKKYIFIHDSTNNDNLIMRDEDNIKAREVLKKVIEKYPDHIIFTSDLTDWVFNREGMFEGEEFDESGIPALCSVAMDGRHKHYLSDLSIENKKTCGHPEIECKTCRLYTSIYTSYFYKKSKQLQCPQSIKEYLSAHNVFYKIFHI